MADGDPERPAAQPIPPGSGRAAPRRVHVQVECYAGSRADETPRSFSWEGRHVEVVEVRDRWRQLERAPGLRRADCFEVLGTDRHVHRLEHDLDSDEWFLVRER